MEEREILQIISAMEMMFHVMSDVCVVSVLCNARCVSEKPI